MIPKLMMYVGGRFPAITPPNNKYTHTRTGSYNNP